MEPLERTRSVDAHLPHPRRYASCGCGHDRQFGGEGSARLSGWKRGAAAQAIGRSRGGRTTKIHAVADGQGRPLAFLLSPGNIADITVAPDLLRLAPPCRVFLADQGYDARALREQAARAGALVVIPNNPTRRNPHPFDVTRYAARNAIERMFCRLKDYRRIATRYDRLARNFASAVALAATISWWV